MSLSEISPKGWSGASRVQTTERPLSLPGQCILCGSPGGDGRHFVDFGHDVDFYGAIIFCSECIVEVANSLGYYSPSQYEALQGRLDHAISENNMLENENAKLRSALDALGTLRSSGVIAGSDSAESDSIAPVVELRPEKDERKADEPVNESGRDDVSGSSSSDDDPFGFTL